MHPLAKLGRFAPMVSLLLCSCGSLLGSSSSSGGKSPPLPAGLVVHVEYARVRDLLSADASAQFQAEVLGATLSAASLTLPDRTVLPLQAVPEGEPVPTAYIVGASAPLEDLTTEFPNGWYTLEITPSDGAVRTVLVYVNGYFPDFPAITTPEDGSVGVPTDVRFEWTGPSVRYDVLLVDEASGVETRIADGIVGFQATPAVLLAPDTAYRLDVRAEVGPPGELVEFESTAVARFVTGGAP